MKILSFILFFLLSFSNLISQDSKGIRVFVSPVMESGFGIMEYGVSGGFSFNQKYDISYQYLRGLTYNYEYNGISVCRNFVIYDDKVPNISFGLKGGFYQNYLDIKPFFRSLYWFNDDMVFEVDFQIRNNLPDVNIGFVFFLF